MGDTHNHYHLAPDVTGDLRDLRAEMRVLSELVELDIRNHVKWRTEIMLKMTELQATAQDLAADLVDFDQKLTVAIAAGNSTAADQASIDAVTADLAAARQRIAELAARVDAMTATAAPPAPAPVTTG